jgi:pimeloyl-ACP methyl ester carboxylesterase
MAAPSVTRWCSGPPSYRSCRQPVTVAQQRRDTPAVRAQCPGGGAPGRRRRWAADHPDQPPAPAPGGACGGADPRAGHVRALHAATLRRLAPAFRVWAPDLPGFGDSDRPRRALDLAELADALAGWMDAVDLPRAALLGNSLGCQVIGHLANRGSVLVSGPGPLTEWFATRRRETDLVNAAVGARLAH